MPFEVEDIDIDEVDPTPAADPGSVAPSGASAGGRGAAFMVQMHDLAMRTDLNGLLGVTGEYNAATDRYCVRVLGTEESVNIRPANLAFGHPLSSMNEGTLRALALSQAGRLAAMAAMPGSHLGGYAAQPSLPGSTAGRLPPLAAPNVDAGVVGIGWIPSVAAPRPSTVATWTAGKTVMTAEARQRSREAVGRDRHAKELQKQMRKQSELARKEADRRAAAVHRGAQKAAVRERKQWEKERVLRLREAARAAERDAREVERCVSDLVRRVEARSGREEKAAEAEAHRQRMALERQHKVLERARREAAEEVEARHRRDRRREARPVVYTSVSVQCGGRVQLCLCSPDETPDVPMALSTVASRLMSEYDASDATEAFGKGHRWTRLLRSAENHLQSAVGAGVSVRSSMGCGRWAFVPWLVVADPGESTQHGLYLQYLFATDMSALYLCLGQGTSKLRKAFGHAAASRHLQLVAGFVRQKCREMLEPGSELHRAGFDLDGGIDLRASAGGASSLAAQYEQGVILSRRYDARNGMPCETEMLSHLRCLLELYARVLRDEDYVSRIVRPSDAQLATVYGAKLAAIRDSVEEEEGSDAERPSDGWGLEEEQTVHPQERVSGPPASGMPQGDGEHGWIRQPSRKGRVGEAEARRPKQLERVWVRLSGVAGRLEMSRGVKRGRERASSDGEEGWLEAQRERSKARRMAQRLYDQASGGETDGGGGVGEGDWYSGLDGPFRPSLPTVAVKTEAAQQADPGAWGGGVENYGCEGQAMRHELGADSGDEALAVRAARGEGVEEEVYGADNRMPEAASHASDSADQLGDLSDQLGEPGDGFGDCVRDAELGESADQLNSSADQLNSSADQLNSSADQLNSSADQLNSSADQLYGATDQLYGATDDESEDGFEALLSMGVEHDELKGLWDEAGGEEEGADGEVGGAGGDGCVALAGNPAARGAAPGPPSRSPSVGTDREAVRRAADRARASAAKSAGIDLDLQMEPLPGSPGFVTEVEGVGKLLLSARNATGYQGVFTSRDKGRTGRSSRYVTFINCGGVTKHIGCFSTALEAAICYSKRKYVLNAKSAHFHKRPRPRHVTHSLLEPFALEPQGKTAHRAAGAPAAPQQRAEALVVPLPMEVEDL